jgi:hypothetical protein
MADTDATVWPHHELGKELSNWGRWGNDDQIGTLNFITPEKLVASAKLVRTGKTIDCGIPFDKNGPFPPGGWRLNPQHLFTLLPSDSSYAKDGQIAADDIIIMGLQASTQWDGLAQRGLRRLLLQRDAREGTQQLPGRLEERHRPGGDQARLPRRAARHRRAEGRGGAA